MMVVVEDARRANCAKQPYAYAFKSCAFLHPNMTCKVYVSGPTYSYSHFPQVKNELSDMVGSIS